jgi:putative transcriptional regulator
MTIIGHNLEEVKGVNKLISYAPLWKTMKRRGATTYTLRFKGKEVNISGSTILRLQKNQSVSTNTLDTLCKILDCSLSDIVEYKPD